MSLIVTAPRRPRPRAHGNNLRARFGLSASTVCNYPFHIGEEFARPLRRRKSGRRANKSARFADPLGRRRAPAQRLETHRQLAGWLESLQSRRGGGFAVNNIGSNSVFSFFEDQRLTFLPEPQNVRLPDKSGNMTSYRRYQFKRTFVAKNVDQYNFGPVSLKGIFVNGISPSGEPRAKTSTPWPRH